MIHLLGRLVFMGLFVACFGTLTHKPRRASETLRALVECITLSGCSLKEVADRLRYDHSQFAKILRGEPHHLLPDLERLMDGLPYAVQKLFIPRLSEIALKQHMQQSADVLSDERMRA